MDIIENLQKKFGFSRLICQKSNNIYNDSEEFITCVNNNS